jgi:hypothetical protein
MLFIQACDRMPECSLSGRLYDHCRKSATRPDDLMRLSAKQIAVCLGALGSFVIYATVVLDETVPDNALPYSCGVALADGRRCRVVLGWVFNVHPDFVTVPTTSLAVKIADHCHALLIDCWKQMWDMAFRAPAAGPAIARGVEMNVCIPRVRNGGWGNRKIVVSTTSERVAKNRNPIACPFPNSIVSA